MTYFCDAEDCPGHSSKAEKCRNRFFPKYLRLPLFKCDAPDCPGHSSSDEKCSISFVRKPKSFESPPSNLGPRDSLSDFFKDKKFPNKSALERKWNESRSPRSGVLDSPGDFLKKDEKVPDRFFPKPKSFELKPFKCDAPDCPGHQFQDEKCQIYAPMIAKSNAPMSRYPVGTSPEISIMDAHRTESLSGPSPGCLVGLSIVVIMLLLIATFLALDVVRNVAIYGSATFGLQRILVAAEGFFLFGGWAGIKATRLFGSKDSNGFAVGFGICCGISAAYLLLTTPEGEEITKYVTASTIRIVGSLFTSLLGPSILSAIWGWIFK